MFVPHFKIYKLNLSFSQLHILYSPHIYFSYSSNHLIQTTRELDLNLKTAILKCIYKHAYHHIIYVYMADYIDRQIAWHTCP